MRVADERVLIAVDDHAGGVVHLQPQGLVGVLFSERRSHLLVQELLIMLLHLTVREVGRFETRSDAHADGDDGDVLGLFPGTALDHAGEDLGEGKPGDREQECADHAEARQEAGRAEHAASCQLISGYSSASPRES
jgi:hypothetical protein